MDLKEIGAKIRAKRKSLGLSQGELAEDVGYSGKDMISKIEAGKVNMAMDKVVAIADRLGLLPSDLLCEPIAKDYRETVNDVDYLIEAVFREHTAYYDSYVNFSVKAAPISLKALNRTGIRITHEGKSGEYQDNPTLHTPEVIL
jgi:transcriptional regulator with XRE-family HTH domain